jgi:hypothetical protein
MARCNIFTAGTAEHTPAHTHPPACTAACMRASPPILHVLVTCLMARASKLRQTPHQTSAYACWCIPTSTSCTAASPIVAHNPSAVQETAQRQSTLPHCERKNTNLPVLLALLPPLLCCEVQRLPWHSYPSRAHTQPVLPLHTSHPLPAICQPLSLLCLG